MESAFNGVLEMHAHDATARGIADGDTVDVFNDRGSIALRAHVNGSVRPGVVAARLNWNKLSAADTTSISSPPSASTTSAAARFSTPCSLTFAKRPRLLQTI